MLLQFYYSATISFNCLHKSLQWLFALLEASSVICDANQLTGFSVMDISIEGNFRTICKIIFFVNRLLLVLGVLRLALIFLKCMVYLVFSTLYYFSTLFCANLFGESCGRFTCFDFGSTCIEHVPWSIQLFLTIPLFTGKIYIFKDAG